MGDIKKRLLIWIMYFRLASNISKGIQIILTLALRLHFPQLNINTSILKLLNFTHQFILLVDSPFSPLIISMWSLTNTSYFFRCLRMLQIRSSFKITITLRIRVPRLMSWVWLNYGNWWVIGLVFIGLCAFLRLFFVFYVWLSFCLVALSFLGCFQCVWFICMYVISFLLLLTLFLFHIHIYLLYIVHLHFIILFILFIFVYFVIFVIFLLSFITFLL